MRRLKSAKNAKILLCIIRGYLSKISYPLVFASLAISSPAIASRVSLATHGANARTTLVAIAQPLTGQFGVGELESSREEKLVTNEFTIRNRSRGVRKNARHEIQ